MTDRKRDDGKEPTELDKRLHTDDLRIVRRASTDDEQTPPEKTRPREARRDASGDSSKPQPDAEDASTGDGT